MPRKGVNIRLRGDQEEAIARIAEEDPETDRSKIVRQAIDEFLKRRGTVKYAEKSPKGKKK